MLSLSKYRNAVYIGFNFFCRPFDRLRDLRFDGLRDLNFYYRNIIWAGDESLAFVMLTTFIKRNLVDGIIKKKRSPIIGYGISIGILIIYSHIAQGLVTTKRHLSALTVA